jgi:hypothetical protein
MATNPYMGPQLPGASTPQQKYTPEVIRKFIQDKGIANNPHAIAMFAKQYGVDPSEVDQALGANPGDSAKWLQDQGLSGPKGTGNYSTGDIQQFIQDKGIKDNPYAIANYADQYGVQPWQVDPAIGANLGDSGRWLQQQFGSNNGTPSMGTPPPGAMASGGPPPQNSADFGGKPPPRSDGMDWELTSSGWAPVRPGQGGGGGQPATNPYMPPSGPPVRLDGPGGPGGQGGQPGQQNPYLGQMADDITRRTNENLTRNVLPSIGRAQVAAGGYGNSRHGIAEGLAMAGSQDSLSGNLANLMGSQFNTDRNYGLQSDALDLSAYNANQNWMNTGQQNQLSFIDKMMNWNQQGITNATNVQNTPMQYWQNFSTGAQGLGGMGGQQSNPYFGNPVMGALGGYQLGNSLFGGGK